MSATPSTDPTHRPTRARTHPPGGAAVRWRCIVLFVVVAFGGAWLAMLPLLLAGFRRSSTDLGVGALESSCIAVMMVTPALGAVTVLLVGHRVRPRQLPARLGLRVGPDRRRFLGYLGLALVLPLLLQVVILLVSALAGTYRFDLVGLSGFRAQFDVAVPGSGLPLAVLTVWVLPLLVNLVTSLPLFLGEELGWQGYLLPALAPAGAAPALLLTGLAFGLWHTPTLVLGGQYPGLAWPAAIAAMVLSTCLLLPVLSWLRIRSGSVWPAVAAHTMVSTGAIQLPWVLGDAGHPFHPLQTGMTGWPGWIVMGALTLVLAATGQLRLGPGRAPGGG